MSAASLWHTLKKGPLRVFVVGGGNWGTAISRIAAQNASNSYIFHDNIEMWLHEEEFNGRKLTELINETHENPKYLPGIPLPTNLIATSDLITAAEKADLIVMVLPHQFVGGVCDMLRGHVNKNAKAISLIKGLQIKDGEPKLISSVVSEALDIPCFVLSGANVANDIAREQFSETTLGFAANDYDTASVWQQLFDTPMFKVNGVPDVAGVEVSGAIKNIVALAAGFCDGLNYGTNTKAAVIRNGVEEMRLFANLFFAGILEDTFFDSAGYADVITTCFGGRNVRCAAEFVRRGGKDSWEKIEADLLNGQKMQGQLTCEEVYQVIEHKKLHRLFPMFTTIYKISFEGAAPSSMIDMMAQEGPRRMKSIEECTACQPPRSTE